MAVVAGIDEAGYGPLLGPLVVSATAFRVPDEAAEADLWERFGSAVTRSAAGAAGRVRVADSKALHKGGNGVRALEENLLPFLSLLGPAPKSAWELVTNCRRPGAASRGEYPWYRDRDLPLPRTASAARISDRAGRLREGLNAAGGAFCHARVETLDVAEFNREVRQDGSKAVPLARRVAALMRQLADVFQQDAVTILVDRQGGRKMYAPLLKEAFPGARFGVSEETDRCSDYCVLRDEHEVSHRLTVRFEPRADSLYLPVALASMLSKYARELHMEMFNGFWSGRVPLLRPTAGYYEDGLRFLAEIEPARAAAGIAMERLVRCR